MEALFVQIIAALAEASVEFIVIGGLAANLHGSARVTYDVDVVYGRSRENLERLARVLAPLHPYPRGAPPGLPFVLDKQTLYNGLNFTLSTDLGPLDLLGEVPGGRDYAELLPYSLELQLPDGVVFRCISLERLIHLKNAAGRPKDFEILAELTAIQQQTQQEERPN